MGCWRSSERAARVYLSTSESDGEIHTARTRAMEHPRRRQERSASIRAEGPLAECIQKGRRSFPIALCLPPITAGFQILQDSRKAASEPSIPEVELSHLKWRLQKPSSRYTRYTTISLFRKRHRDTYLYTIKLAYWTVMHFYTVSY